MISRFSKIGIAGSVTLFASYGVYHKNDLNSWGVVRFGRAAIAATMIAFDYKWNLTNVEVDSLEYENLLSQIHLRSAHRIREVCCKNGGCFIKVGQHIGGLDYLLPLEYVNTMKILHNNAPESDIKELYETVETDLKCKISDVFKHIDDKPIGTASLAQVHKAVLHDGTVVAVKIQHPKVKKHSHGDIETIAFFVDTMARIFPKFNLVWLAEETRKNLPIELDFINEGKNCEKVAKLFKHCPYVKVPKIYWDLTSDRVLTMEYCEGTRVDDVDTMKSNNIDVNMISKRLGVIFSEMIFTHGFVHADPHPGNVLINPIKNKKLNKQSNDFEIVLIDHGLYQNLSRTFRYNYANVWMAILQQDVERIKELTKKFDANIYYGLFACVITGRSWDSIQSGIKTVKYTNKEGVEIKAEAAKYLREISDLLNRVPREMLLLLKTNDLIRGIETRLNTRNSQSAFIHMSECCVKLIHSYEREMNRKLHFNDNTKSLYENVYLILKFSLFSYLFEKWELFKIFSYKFYLTILNI